MVPPPSGSTFNTPSAFSVHVKRLVTPNKQGDDGWHSVYVDGVLLNAVRQQYHAKMLGQPYKPQPNKTPRRSQSSPRGQQQQQQQQQQQAQAAQQQQQQLGLRPPLPMPKLKLGNIKGLPQQQQQGAVASGVQQQQQQQQVQGGGLQADPGQGQPVKPPAPQKLKLKLGKLGGNAAAGLKPPAGGAGSVTAAAAAGGGGGVGLGHMGLQPQGGGVGAHCPLDPHPPMLQVCQQGNCNMCAGGAHGGGRDTNVEPCGGVECV